MAAPVNPHRLTLQYDRDADILFIQKCPPYAEQESEELGDGVVARLNPSTQEVEALEVLFFSSHVLQDGSIDLPVDADLRLLNARG